MDRRTAGLALLAVGFLLAVPAGYFVARMSEEDLLRLIRFTIVAFLVALGSLLGATGALLLRGVGQRR